MVTAYVLGYAATPVTFQIDGESERASCWAVQSTRFDANKDNDEGRAAGSYLLAGACAGDEDDEETTAYRYRSTATGFDENRATTEGLAGNRGWR
ncbi:unnamed protein product [Linum trigynum]|uniref:Uncharacterized protein n=1 Tax=Linum trigynum TaxID=586398 RepID=A0AAV2CHT5_9ROSI